MSRSPCARCVGRFSLALAAALVMAVLGASVTAQEWPPLQQGMWEVVRTMTAPGGGQPKTLTAKRCIDPSEDWKRQNATLAKAGCTFTPMRRSGNTFTFTAACKVMGTSSSSTTTIVYESPTAYTMTVAGTTDGKPTKEEARGRRVGDCSR